jgi:hypothetical protein
VESNAPVQSTHARTVGPSGRPSSKSPPHGSSNILLVLAKQGWPFSARRYNTYASRTYASRTFNDVVRANYSIIRLPLLNGSDTPDALRRVAFPPPSLGHVDGPFF